MGSRRLMMLTGLGAAAAACLLWAVGRLRQRLDRFESEVAARVTEIAMAAGGHLAFPVIATVHGETLHNHFHGNVLRSGDAFLLDCGAESPEHYAGDLSSTFPVDRSFTSRQKDVYRVVLEAHLAAVAAAAPLVPMLEVHRVACRCIAQGMKDLGLMRGDVDDAVQAGAHALFFPCGTGHMLGLDVHDMEDLGEVWVGYTNQSFGVLGAQGITRINETTGRWSHWTEKDLGTHCPVQSLWPTPEKAILQAVSIEPAQIVKQVIVAELNLGGFHREV